VALHDCKVVSRWAPVGGPAQSYRHRAQRRAAGRCCTSRKPE
jgi:hypothetical protein